MPNLLGMRRTLASVLLAALMVAAFAAPSIAGEPPSAVASTSAGSQEGILGESCWSNHDPPFVVERCESTPGWEGPFPRKPLPTKAKEEVVVALEKPEPPSAVRVRYWSRAGWTPFGPEAFGKPRTVETGLTHEITADGLRWLVSFDMPAGERALVEVRVEWDLDVGCPGCGQTQWGEWYFNLRS